MEIRCAVGPGSALPAQTLDPAEDLRPRPRRHTVPANEMLVRFYPGTPYLFAIIVITAFRLSVKKKNDAQIFVEKKDIIAK